MSTTFGIPIRELEFNENITDSSGELRDYVSEDFFIKVFFRGNVAGSTFVDRVASMLPDETRVYALDNSAQGIYTIGDCKKLLKEEYI